MDVLLFQPERFQQLYNCSFYDVNQMPQEKRRQRLLGVMTFPSAALALFLYILCVTAMLKPSQRKLASYKIMLLLAFFHLYGIFLSGWVTSYFYYYGTVFCEMPLTIYVLGAYGTATWIGGTVTGVILSFNRCCEMYGAHVAQALFGGPKVFAWLLIPLALYAYDFLFTKPLLFSGIAMSWYFNPHVYYYDDYGTVYRNALHTANNTCTLAAQVCLSTAFVALYFGRIRRRATKMSKNDKLMCLQVFIIGLFELSAGLTFLIQQRYSIGLAGTMTACVCYYGSQACAPFVYLTFNRTIRHSVVDDYFPCMSKKSHVSSASHLTSGKTSSMAG